MKKQQNHFLHTVQLGMIGFSLLNISLISYGISRFPTSMTASSDGVKGLVADIFILTVYASVGYWGAARTSRLNPTILRLSLVFGLLATTIYLGVVEIEYVVRFTDAGGRTLGIAMVSTLFVLFFLAGVFGGFVTKLARVGVVTAVWCAAIGAIMWFAAVMTTYYAYLGTKQQEHVLFVENHDDFVRSGMTDFHAFILQDFMGACFYHLLMTPLFAAILGSAGGWMGKWMKNLMERRALKAV